VAKSRTKKELSEEVDLLDSMLSSLIDMLEEKRILTRTEWEEKIKKDIQVK
jgi:hypothetical protein